MRRLLHGDVVAVARVLMDRDPRRWPWGLCRMRREAHRAQLWRVRSGRQHPLWGDGSLASAALRRHPRREPPLSDRRYRWALIFVLAFAAGT